jgi:plastocyanin
MIRGTGWPVKGPEEVVLARPWRVVAGVVVTLVVAGGCGDGDGDADSRAEPTVAADQTVEIEMVDNAFEPDVVTVKSGTTVRFRFRNTGRLVHDAAFGDEAAQQAVEDNKRKAEVGATAPGGTKEYVRRFDTAGTLIIGCHQPGHYRQGMKARLIVA